jgi:excisionase family DNA binding protein
MEPGIYTVTEASKILEVSKETVRRWCRSGKITAWLSHGSRRLGWRITGQELSDLLGPAGAGRIIHQGELPGCERES